MSGENITVFSCLSILPLRSTSPGSLSRCQIFMPCMAGRWKLSDRMSRLCGCSTVPYAHCPWQKVWLCKRKNISQHYRVTIECKQKGQFHWDGRTQLYQVQTIKLMTYSRRIGQDTSVPGARYCKLSWNMGLRAMRISNKSGPSRPKDWVVASVDVHTIKLRQPTE